MAVLNRGEVWRRTYACWMGKNAGGTLGAPVEGQPGPHNFDWYPKLSGGRNSQRRLGNAIGLVGCCQEGELAD